MAFYQLYPASEEEQESILNLFPRSRELSKQNQKLAADAYNTVLKNTGCKSLEEVDFDKEPVNYRLVDHINEVIELSLYLLEASDDMWDDSFTKDASREDMIMLALMHDLDKVMLHDKNQLADNLDGRISHGYLSGLILNDLGAPERLVSLVAYHSPKACMSIRDPLAMILHYADLYSADHIYMLRGKKPFYFN